MAKTRIFVKTEVASLMKKMDLSILPSAKIICVDRFGPEKDKMSEVIVEYNSPQDLFLLGMLATKAWAEEIKSSMGDDGLYNLKFRG